VLRPHHFSIPFTIGAGIADVASMIIKVGEDFEKKFDWKLENCEIEVRSKSRRTG